MSQSSNTDKLYPIKYDPDFMVVTANDLIKGRQKMTKREAELLFVAMAQVVKEDKDFKTYTTTIPELARFMGVTPEALYPDIKKICRNLLSRVVEVQVGGENAGEKTKWRMFQWVNCAEYENGRLTIRLADDIKPYMLELASYYNQARLSVLCSFSSYYATRLYQIISCDIGQSLGNKDVWTFSCTEIRELFQTEHQYKLNRDLINRTIKVAIDELRRSDYIYIWDYKELKGRTKGNPLIGVSFRACLCKNKEEKDKFVNVVLPTIKRLYPEDYPDG